MVLKEGLEPSRYCYHRILSPVRLPFRHFSINGAPPETRTPDPFIKSEMLYHWASGTIIGWVGWIRTNACQNQNLMPYRLATTQLMVDRSGFEPLNPREADLQSAAFGRFAICPLIAQLNVLYIISYKREIFRILTL